MFLKKPSFVLSASNVPFTFKLRATGRFPANFSIKNLLSFIKIPP